MFRSTMPRLIGVLGCIVALAACVERKERINIAPNGSVHYVVTHTSQSVRELYEMDAFPRAASGWIASQEVDVDEEGKETYRLIAEMLFAPGVALPSNFALPNESDPDLYLQFPTTLKIEERADGVYYHFARRYEARSWTPIAAIEQRTVKAAMNDVEDIEPGQWTDAQRRAIVRAFAEFETEKMLHFSREAFARALPDLPQDAWLLVRQHMRDCLHQYDYERLAELLLPRDAPAEEELRGEAIEAELAAFDELAHAQLKQSLFTVAGLTGPQYTAFMAEFDRRKKNWDITKSLGGHRFEITVEMPGRIIASNADSASDSAATWRFEGGVIRDRDMELLVTSRVPIER